METLNSTVQMARIAASQYFVNNAQRVEGVLLNMIFFSYKIDDRLSKRDDTKEEIYPGCSRRECTSSGHYEGVIPPRAWDMDGSVIPMKDRGRGELRQTDRLTTFLIMSVQRKQ